MNVCLATAPIIAEYQAVEELENDLVQAYAQEPQLGVLSLGAVVEARGGTPRIVDLDGVYLRTRTQNRDFVEAAAEEMSSASAPVYGFSTICSSYPLTLRIAQRLKAIQPDSTIVLGGPQASVVDMPTLAAFPFVDMVLRGEAEKTLPALLDQLQAGSHLEQVPGLTYRIGAQLKRTPNAPPIPNLDELPFPAYHLVKRPANMHIASLELGRGCPFACTFCSTNDFFRRNFRLRSPERVLDDMRRIAAQYGIRQFQLVHDMFTVDRKRVVAFCNTMLASGDEFTWACSARTDCIDEALLELMFRSGCSGIFFGVETGSSRMQKIINKHLDLGKAKNMIAAAERIGIATTVSLITGFPEETWDDVQETLRVFIYSLGFPRSTPQLNVLAPLAETPLFSRYKDELSLDELCSSMSHQAAEQFEDDLKLIRAHRDIFPNFYLIPLPDLDRAAILELREFALAHLSGLRWILVAVECSNSDVLELFFHWRKHRLQICGDLHGLPLRHYYRTPQFRRDYLDFLRTHPVGKFPVVQALLDYNESVLRNSKMNAVPPPGFTVASEDPLDWTDVPMKKSDVALVEIDFDLQQVIDALKNRSELVWSRGRYFYAVRFTSDMGDKKGRADKISDWMASLLQACNGHRTIEEVVACLSADLIEIDQAQREYAALQLMEGARSEGLVEIYRNPANEIPAPNDYTHASA
jgi:radical SAM superfamily enzyme YgiQ (UPF0313 family)